MSVPKCDKKTHLLTNISVYPENFPFSWSIPAPCTLVAKVTAWLPYLACVSGVKTCALTGLGVSFLGLWLTRLHTQDVDILCLAMEGPPPPTWLALSQYPYGIPSFSQLSLIKGHRRRSLWPWPSRPQQKQKFGSCSYVKRSQIGSNIPILNFFQRNKGFKISRLTLILMNSLHSLHSTSPSSTSTSSK